MVQSNTDNAAGLALAAFHPGPVPKNVGAIIDMVLANAAALTGGATVLIVLILLLRKVKNFTIQKIVDACASGIQTFMKFFSNIGDLLDLPHAWINNAITGRREKKDQEHRIKLEKEYGELRFDFAAKVHELAKKIQSDAGGELTYSDALREAKELLGGEKMREISEKAEDDDDEENGPPQLMPV